MIFGFSPHTGHTISSEILRAIIYFLQEMARKNLAGKRVIIRRDPAPELLLGNPDLMLTVVRSLLINDGWYNGVLIPRLITVCWLKCPDSATMECSHSMVE